MVSNYGINWMLLCKILNLLEHPSKCKEIGKYNYEYAKEHFMASKVALEIENHIYKLFEQ